MPEAGDWVNVEGFSEDCEYFDLPTGEVWRGRKRMREMKDGMQGAMGSSTDSRVIDHFESGNLSVAWWEWSGKFESDWGAVPAKGKPFTLQGITVIVRDEDGLIVKQIDSYDMLTHMSQYGVVPKYSDLVAGTAKVRGADES